MQLVWGEPPQARGPPLRLELQTVTTSNSSLRTLHKTHLVLLTSFPHFHTTSTRVYSAAQAPEQRGIEAEKDRNVTQP
uniref:Uncharacterized protein n=1 Tax=Knipowitschia caucasica TaxID=637954 RepID=A0AAV2ML48_KNICA